MIEAKDVKLLDFLYHGRNKGIEADRTNNLIGIGRINCNSFFNIPELKEIHEELYQS